MQVVDFHVVSETNAQFLLVESSFLKKQILVGGFNPLKNMKVSWDDDIPKIWKNKNHVPNHQPEPHCIYIYISHYIPFFRSPSKSSCWSNQPEYVTSEST